ncbi:MAG TPA: agmatinase [Phycisphaerae bacterium]|nr:agmatinase [Phycisphaerae bacterium]
MNTIPNVFGGLEPRFTDYKKARYAVLPVPYEATTSYRGGAGNGPQAIITASQQVELFDDELGAEFHAAGIATLDALEPNAAGPEAMHADVHAAARRIVRAGKFLIGLGGEHGITAGLVRAVAGKHRDLSVLQIDAHLDLRDSYQQSRYSHASAMRRTLPFVQTVVPVGIRSVSLEEHRFLRRKGTPVHPVTARECCESDDWIDRVLDRLGSRVYVTVDIDGFDPAYAPGTGTPEPGGLDWYQVTSLLRLVAAEKHIVAADVVEVAPIPGQVATEFLAARLAYKIICYTQAADRL